MQYCDFSMYRAERAIDENLPVICLLQGNLRTTSPGSLKEQLTFRLVQVARNFL